MSFLRWKVSRMLLQFQTVIPDSVLTGIVVFSILLAVGTMLLMRVRTEPAGDDGERKRPPFDPVLLASALAVIIMAGIAFMAL